MRSSAQLGMYERMDVEAVSQPAPQLCDKRSNVACRLLWGAAGTNPEFTSVTDYRDVA